MNYSPTDLYVWDAWYMAVDDQVHAYHLARKRGAANVAADVENSLGHAVTRDLVHWERRPPAFGPDPANPLDDRQPWTGCAVWHEGRGYLYYTMRGSADQCRIQRIGLGTSADGEHWQRHAGNPIIVPDPRWYATDQAPVPRIVDCRDLIVIPDPKGGWLGFYATRIPGSPGRRRGEPGGELPQTAAIACVRSPDLLRWEHLPPAFAPGKYACIEVPDVFEMGGRWYMTCLTGHWYGNRGIWSDPNLVCGTMFAVADRPEGPYRELADNALLAARWTAPLSCRSVLFQGQRYLLYTDRERVGRTDAGDMTFGTLTTPKLLRTDGERLYAAYCDRIECDVVEELVGPSRPPVQEPGRLWGQIWQMPSARWDWGPEIAGRSSTGWGVARLPFEAESFILEATVTIQQGVAAGLALRMSGEMSGAIVALEPSGPTGPAVAYYEAPAFDFVEARRTPIVLGKPLRLRIVNRLEHVEIYVNDDLRLAFSRYRGIGGKVGLFVDRAAATFRDVRLARLSQIEGWDRPKPNDLAKNGPKVSTTAAASADVAGGWAR